MATWSDDILKALENLGGTANYEDIYSEIKRIRVNLPQSWKQVIQRTIQDKSSDSDGFKGNEDLFYAVNGLGSGVWGLRPKYSKEEIEALFQTKVLDTFEEIQQDFEDRVNKSKKDKRNIRLYRLEKANTIPKKIKTTITIYSRNPDVVAETLLRAGGICEKCKNSAPFKRSTDGAPFLEVHHIKQLAHGGEDTVDNTLALCPNCHREQHYG